MEKIMGEWDGKLPEDLCGMTNQQVLDKVTEAYGAGQENGLASATAWKPTYRHVKRGFEYELVGRARLQTETPLPDDADVVIYRGKAGDLWARAAAEFEDGRFEPLPPTGDR